MTYLVLFIAYLHSCPKCHDVILQKAAASYIQGTPRCPTKEKWPQSERSRTKTGKWGIKRNKQCQWQIPRPEEKRLAENGMVSKGWERKRAVKLMRRDTVILKQEHGQEVWGDQSGKVRGGWQKGKWEIAARAARLQKGPEEPPPRLNWLTWVTPKTLLEYKVWLPKLGHRNKSYVASFSCHMVPGKSAAVFWGHKDNPQRTTEKFQWGGTSGQEPGPQDLQEGLSQEVSVWCSVHWSMHSHTVDYSRGDTEEPGGVPYSLCGLALQGQRRKAGWGHRGLQWPFMGH